MSAVVEWQPKTPSEVVLRYADFTDELSATDFLTTVATAATVYSGNDPAPAIISLTTLINNAAGSVAIAQVKVLGGILGTLYQCVVTASTNLGLTLTKTAVIAIKPPLN